MMTNQTDERDDFGDALAYSANVPLAWKESESSPIDIFFELNEQCLQTVLNLSEYHVPENSEEPTAISVIERKVDITLQMVSELLRTTVDMPSIKAIRLGAHEISWHEPASLPVLNAELDLEIYLHDLYPKPFRVRGQVKTINDQQCVVGLASQSDDIQQLLEKFIFLHHRRAIALAKKGE
ncbi:MAG: hypothetical protein KAT25_01640 [Sulfuriflexus sp.]|nr:hypothetical protein [Sulfuriflexus sp.]